MGFAAALCLFSSACLAEGVSLNRVYKLGDKDRYKVNITVEGSYMPAGETTRKTIKSEINAVKEEETKEMRADGSILLVNTLVSGKLMIDGQEETMRGVGGSSVTGWDKNGFPFKPYGTPEVTAAMTQLDGLPGLFFRVDHNMNIGDELHYEIPVGLTKEQCIRETITLTALQKPQGDSSSEILKVLCRGDGQTMAGTVEYEKDKKKIVWQVKKDKQTEEWLVPSMVRNVLQNLHVETTTLLDARTRKAIQVDGKITSARFGELENVTITYKRVKL